MSEYLRRVSRRSVWAVTVAFIMGASVSNASGALPSCTLDADQVALTAELDIVRVSVDSHGNFFAPVVLDVLNATFLDQYGVVPWAMRTFSEGFLRVKYHTTAELETKVCAAGKKIVFDERRFGSDEFAPTFDAVAPKPYLSVRELAGIGLGIYFLSALGADYDFVIDGGAGRGFSTTSGGFRLPRVGADLIPVHRFYGHPSGGAGSHFYTGDPTEFEAMQRRIERGERYTYEGVAFFAPRAVRQSDGSFACSSAELQPVNRLHLAPSKESGPFAYRYVLDIARAKSMQRQRWVNQGATFCALRE